MATDLGHSLWFVPPPGGVRAQLDRIITDLAKKYSAPAFVPHMTLAPDISFSQVSIEKSVDFTSSLGEQIPSFPLTFKTIDGAPGSLYQCLYLKCELTPELLKAVNLARTALNRDLTNPAFKPHISICYKEALPEHTKKEIISELGNSLIGLSFMARGIQIWTNGEPINNWRQIGPEIPLHV